MADHSTKASAPIYTTKYKPHPTEKMQAAQWMGTKSVKIADVPKPTITAPKDAIVRVTHCCICGSDLHMYGGEMNMAMQPGDILGHEAIGYIQDVGPEVQNFQAGDRVIILPVIACGECFYCQKKEYSLCDRTNPSEAMDSLYGHRLSGIFADSAFPATHGDNINNNNGVKYSSMAGFPHFEDGDVHIIITGSRQYQLHSAVLRSNSPVMARILNEENAARLSSRAIKRGATVKFRIIMTDNTTRNGGLRYALKAVPLNEEGKPIEHQIVGLDLENGRVVPSEVLAYESVFSALYNSPIDLGDFETDGMVHVLTRVWGVVDAAEQLQCTHVVTHAIEATLLATGQLLQQSIATRPSPWLNLAYKIRSRNLFRESLIHAAGKYNTEEIQKAIVEMPKDVAELLHKKGRTLRGAVKMAEKRILSYYPTHLQREKTVGRADKDNIGRASYSNDVMSWIGLVVLRHFFTQLLADDATHNAPDMGKELVDAVIQGGDTYLDKGIMDQFHAYFPMSQKGASVLENKVSEMKESIKKFMADLHKNESMLDTKTFKVAHLTCVKVFQHDYPFGEARKNVVVEEADEMSE